MFLVEKSKEHSNKKHSNILKNKRNDLNVLLFPNKQRTNRSRSRNETNSNGVLNGTKDSHAKSWMSLNSLEDNLLNEDHKCVILTPDSDENLVQLVDCVQTTSTTSDSAEQQIALDDNVFVDDDVEMRKKYFSTMRLKSLNSKKIYANYDYMNGKNPNDDDNNQDGEEEDLLGTKQDEAIIDSLLNDIEFELNKKSSNNSSISNSPQFNHIHRDINHSNRKVHLESASLPNTPPILLNMCNCKIKCDCMCHLYVKRSESQSSKFSSSSNRTTRSLHMTSSHESLDWDMSLDLESHVDFDSLLECAQNNSDNTEINKKLNEKISKLDRFGFRQS